MRLRAGFITHDAGGESLLVPAGGAGWSGVVRGNRTLGAMLALLREGTTEEAMVAALRGRYDAPEGAVERDVSRLLAELRGIGALDE